MTESEVLTCEYRLSLETGADIEQALTLLTGEISCGTEYIAGSPGYMWPSKSRLPARIIRRYHASILSVECIGSDQYSVRVRVPLENFSLDTGGLTNVLAAVAGDIYNVPGIRSISLNDITVPESVLTHYGGPRYGSEGLSRCSGKRTYLGAVIKPNVGLDCQDFCELCRALFRFGIDWIKDDEILVSPENCSLHERIERMTSLCQDIMSETGRVVYYSANITCDFLHLDGILRSLSDLPPSIMIDAIPMGLSAIAFLRHTTTTPIYVHRTMYRALYQSIRPHILLFLMRIYGADVLHIGNPVAANVRKEVMKNLEAIRERSRQIVKPCLPVITGVGIENLTSCLEAVGPDVLLMCCGELYRGRDLERQIESLRSQLECKHGRALEGL